MDNDIIFIDAESEHLHFMYFQLESRIETDSLFKLVCSQDKAEGWNCDVEAAIDIVRKWSSHPNIENRFERVATLTRKIKELGQGGGPVFYVDGVPSEVEKFTKKYKLPNQINL